jgi:UDP:flavonoid glycosyltransferase YjiC (YdhE family)
VRRRSRFRPRRLQPCASSSRPILSDHPDAKRQGLARLWSAPGEPCEVGRGRVLREGALRFLFTTYEGGGHVAPAILLAGLMQSRGHEVLFVSDEANRTAATVAGLAFRAWRTAPNRVGVGQADDPMKDWRHVWPPAVVGAVCDAVITGPADAYAADAEALIREFRPHLVVTNELLFGVILACEALGQPVALATANLWPFPDRGEVPPFGPGWPQARTEFERRREASARPLISRWYDVGLPALNAARRARGLHPLDRALDQLEVARPILLGCSAAFDFDAPARSPFIYAGPLLKLGRGTPAHPLVAPDRRNILLSLSTTYQRQKGMYVRCVRALAALDANIIVTTGPAVRPGDLPTAPNLRIVNYAPHDQIVPYVDLVVCHGGHGTLMRPILYGVPVLCLPMGRDHPDNGRRLVEHGAGLVSSRRSPVLLIRHKAQRLLRDFRFRHAAQQLGRRVADTAERERQEAIAALEAAAQRSRID